VDRSIFGQIPADLLVAKATLRDRLVPAITRQILRAAVVRKKRQYTPTPGVNLVGIGIGEKVVARRRTGELCVKVLVARKYPKGKIARSDRIPPTIGGIPTDIEGVGYTRRFQIANEQRQRPVPGGVSGSLGPEAVTARYAGTLGLIVTDQATPPARYVLSNNHVLADENRASRGASVVQPATLDGGTAADRVASLTRFVPLVFNNAPNVMDAAIAQFDTTATGAPTILGLGGPTGTADPTLNLLVRKSGRTTGVTEGIVRTLHFDAFNIRYEQGVVRMDDVMVIEGVQGAFSRPGDSGSAIVDAGGRVVGLLFAGGDTVTFAIPLPRILRQFGVSLPA
jgi:S1-C subfamily serine protease